MAKATTVKSTKEEVGMLDQVANFFDLERSFIVFSLIYIPVAILFYNQGALEKMLLLIYTLLLGFVGALMVIKFVLFLAKAANTHKSNYGGLFVMYFFQVLIPLVMFKLLGYVSIQMLPHKHYGLMCDLKRFVVDLYYNVFQYQDTLSTLIAGSFIVVAGLAVWSVGRK